MINPGKQYNRLPVLFYEIQEDFKAITKATPQPRDEVGMMQAMLERGEISSSA